jgi:hypothetical protein
VAQFFVEAFDVRRRNELAIGDDTFGKYTRIYKEILLQQYSRFNKISGKKMVVVYILGAVENQDKK